MKLSWLAHLCLCSALVFVSVIRASASVTSARILDAIQGNVYPMAFNSSTGKWTGYAYFAVEGVGYRQYKILSNSSTTGNHTTATFSLSSVGCYHFVWEAGTEQPTTSLVAKNDCLASVPPVSVGAMAPNATWMVQGKREEKLGFSANISLISAANSTEFPRPLSLLTFNATWYTNRIVRVRLTDPTAARFEVPQEVVALQEPSSLPTEPWIDVRIGDNGDDFNLLIERNDSAADGPLWDGTSMYYSDQYIQLGTRMASLNRLVGLGERIGGLVYNTEFPQSYTAMASDHATPPKLPLYASHGFVMDCRQDGLCSGLFLLNSNAMDTVLEDRELTFRTTGGVIDLFVFNGPNAQDVLEQYHSIIGHPYLPPLWSLGYHQCRWGYTNISAVRAVVDQFDSHSLPLDVVWTDIDYMDNWKVFTTDPVHFPAAEFRAFIEFLHAKNQSFVPIIDPGVKIEHNYSAYESGMQQNVFLLDPTGEAPAVGKVWPGLVHFPDWTHPNASNWWTLNIKEWHAQIPIDGMWTDMNEVANFCDGRCKLDPWVPQPGVDLFACKCPELFNESLIRQWDDPPFVPPAVKFRGWGGLQSCRSLDPIPSGLDCGTLSMAVRHHDGELEYNLHNMFGHQEAVLTAKALQDTRGKRSFVLSRSTFPSSGRFVSHWLGDNTASWQSMRDSIPGILNFNLFGVPHVGADICGFSGDTSPELCARWMQLGTLSPFRRNHNTHYTRSQEPYALGAVTLAASKVALYTRYTLLSYLYTLHQIAHAHGGCVACPLFYHFQYDEFTFTDVVNRQFLLGRGLLVSPVLEEGAEYVSAYFPGQQVDWYDYYTGERVVNEYSNKTLQLYAPLNNSQITPRIPLHVAAGSIIPLQEGLLEAGVRNTKGLWNIPYTLLVALPSDQAPGGYLATGYLILDDGETLVETRQTQNALLNVSFRVARWNAGTAGSFTLMSSIRGDGFNVTLNGTTIHSSSLRIKDVRVFGAMCEPSGAVVHGGGYPNHTPVTVTVGNISDHNTSHVLHMNELSLSLDTPFVLQVQCGASPAPTPAPEPTQAPGPGGAGSSLSKQNKIDIGVGVGVGVLLLALIVYGCRKTGYINRYRGGSALLDMEDSLGDPSINRSPVDTADVTQSPTAQLDAEDDGLI